MHSYWGTVIGPAVVYALAVAPHELLYVILPLYAADFGITLAWVGALLSVNRLIRVVAYGAVTAATRRIGPKRMFVLCAVLAILATIGYAVAWGPGPLLATRLLWGVAFAGLNLCSLVYALSTMEGAGARVGTSRCIAAFGPALAYSAGSFAVIWLGPRDIFLVLAAITVVAAIIATRLPALPTSDTPAVQKRLGKPSRVDIFYFTVGMGADGVLIVTITILMADRVPMEYALVSSGLILSLRPFSSVVIAPLGGWMADRFGAVNMQLLFGAAMVAGFGAVAAGLVLVGALLIVVSRSALGTLGAVFAAERAGADPMSALSRLATWTDLGGAVGPFVTGLAIAVVPIAALYAAATVIIALALLNVARESRRRSPSDVAL